PACFYLSAKRIQVMTSFPGRLCGFLLLLASFAFAQDRGTITGIVTDGTGSAVPGTLVTVKNSGTGLNQSGLSGPDGSYTLPYLPAGKYSVAAEKSGFLLAEASDVTVSVNSITRFDVRLELGEVRQVV